MSVKTEVIFWSGITVPVQIGNQNHLAHFGAGGSDHNLNSQNFSITQKYFPWTSNHTSDTQNNCLEQFSVNAQNLLVTRGLVCNLHGKIIQVLSYRNMTYYFGIGRQWATISLTDLFQYVIYYIGNMFKKLVTLTKVMSVSEY